ncbi:MAG: FmdB family transcriptional regulator [Kineosporiaceae bacterium]|nr:FmdB family transcriptional regulator [Kineosporiaceae bacterium]
MPTYAYACTACDHRFEAQQAFTDDALTECPECQGRLRKLFNAVGIVFKGSGFYRTDSRGSSSSTTAAAGGSGTPSTGSSSDSPGSTGASSSGGSTSSGSSTGGSTSSGSSAGSSGGSTAAKTTAA